MGTSLAPTKRKAAGSSANPKQNHAAKKAVPRRTTVTLSAETVEIVERYRQATGLSMSDAISAIIERSEPKPPRIRYVDGLPIADIPMNGKRITNEDILRAQGELG
jgi:hypothetical protein